MTQTPVVVVGGGAAVFGIFDDENDKINLSLDDVGGELLVGTNGEARRSSFR